MSKIKKHKVTFWAIGLTLTLFFSAYNAKGQIEEQYGQNIVNYKYINWNYFDTSHFRLFFDKRDKNIAILAGNMAEDISAKLAKKLKFYIDYKSNLVVFTSYNEFIESNILGTNDDIILNTAGKLRLVGKTYAIYYDGKVEAMDRQIREQIIRGAVEEIIYGNDKKNLARSTLSKDIPFWFSEGLTAYLTDSITLYDINKLKAYSVQQRKGKLNVYRMAASDPILAGKFFWCMFEEMHSSKEIMRFLSYSVGLRSYSHALKKMMRGKEYEGLKKEWAKYCKKLIEFNSEEILEDTTRSYDIKFPIKELESVDNFSVSPIANEVFYVKRKLNHWEVRSHNEYGKDITILSGPKFGYGKKIDKVNPILTWSHNGQKLGIIFYKRGIYRLKLYNALSREFFTRPLKSKQFQRIMSASFTESNNNMLMSVVNRGTSDIILYEISTKKVTKLTDDDFTDLEPIYVYSKLRKGLFWLSNRDSTNIKRSRNRFGDIQSVNYNIYYKDYRNLTDTVVKLTNYNESIISHLNQFDENSITFLLDSNNRRYQMILQFEKRDNKIDTFSIFELPAAGYPIDNQYVRHTKQIANINFQEDTLYVEKYDPELFLLDTLYQPVVDAYRQMQDSIIQSKQPDIIKYREDPNNNFFMSSYFDENIRGDIQDYIDIDSSRGGALSKKRIKLFKALPNFKLNEAGFSFNNQLLGSKYQSIQATGVGFSSPPINEMLSINISDVMEDYIIEGGLKFNFSENGSEVLLGYTNNRRKIDWRVVAYRKASNRIFEDGKSVLTNLEPRVIYPFTDLARAELAVGWRRDSRVGLPQSPNELAQPEFKQDWLSGQLAYVYDESYSPEFNVSKGQRVKLYYEFFQNFKDKKTISNFTIDAREYLPLYRNIVWANRFVASASYGNARILYYLGGVQNEILTTNISDNFSTGALANLNNPWVTVDPDQDFIFQTKSAPLRGYRNNVRNGNGYLLLNSEVRIPIFSSFINRPTTSNFLRSLQILVFGDWGTAWNGNFPNDDNTRTPLFIPPVAPGQPGLIIENPQINAPFGFGSGFRAALWGYYTRVDFAWNNRNFQRNPFIHLSFGLDF